MYGARASVPRHSGACEARARNPFIHTGCGLMDSGLSLREPRNDADKVWNRKRVLRAEIFADRADPRPDRGIGAAVITHWIRPTICGRTHPLDLRFGRRGCVR